MEWRFQNTSFSSYSFRCLSFFFFSFLSFSFCFFLSFLFYPPFHSVLCGCMYYPMTSAVSNTLRAAGTDREGLSDPQIFPRRPQLQWEDHRRGNFSGQTGASARGYDGGERHICNKVLLLCVCNTVLPSYVTRCYLHT